MNDWAPRVEIDVLVTNHTAGGLSLAGVGGRFLFTAKPYGFAMYRVSDGVADFRFTQKDLDDQLWIKEAL